MRHAQDEDPLAFEARVHGAKAAREVAEAELRLLFYVDSLAATTEVLHTYNYAAAVERVAGQVRGAKVGSRRRGWGGGWGAPRRGWLPPQRCCTPTASQLPYAAAVERVLFGAGAAQGVE